MPRDKDYEHPWPFSDADIKRAAFFAAVVVIALQTYIIVLTVRAMMNPPAQHEMVIE